MSTVGTEHEEGRTSARVGALDGLRGVAVAAVLAFHLQLGWARGGFLGVSAFFTLSGFLICSLLLEEHGRNGRIALGAFWARRFRRLLPAALCALAGVTAVVALGWAPGPSTLGPDVVAAAAYVANWRFVASAQSYGALFAAPSPVLHFWSLAIEEQFYVVFPVVVAAAVRIGGRRALLATLALLATASVVAGLVWSGGDPARAYYGTDVRAVELLVGALLAMVLSTRSSLASVVRRVCRWIAPLAVVALGAAWVTTAQGSTALFRGGLAVHAVLVAVVIAAVSGGSGGVLGRVLSVAPLRGLGRISYGVYLFHWPLFVWLTPARTGLTGSALTAVRLGATVALAVVSFVLIEEPIRSGRRLRPVTARVGGLITAGAVMAGALLALPSPVPEARTTLAAPSVVPSAPVAFVSPSEDAVPTTAPPAPTQVYVAGDSTALLLGTHLDRWAANTGRIRVWTSGWLACPVVRGGAYRYAGVAKTTTRKCNGWEAVRREEVASIRPDVVVVSSGLFDVLDHRREGSRTWEHVGQAAYDELVRAELAALQSVLLSGGGAPRLVWLTSPYVKTGGNETGYRPPRPFPEWDHARVDRYNAIVREVAATSPAASVIDFQAHLRSAWGDEEDPAFRPDGIHASEAAAADLAAWLGPQLASR